MAYPLLNVLDVMIFTRMLFSCLVDANFLDIAVIVVCFNCTVAPQTGSVDQNTRKLSSDHHRECIGMTDGASLELFLILLRLAEGMRFNIQENAMTEIALFYCTNPL